MNRPQRSREHRSGRHAGAGDEQRPPIRTHGGEGAGLVVTSPAESRAGRWPGGGQAIRWATSSTAPATPAPTSDGMAPTTRVLRPVDEARIPTTPSTTAPPMAMSRRPRTVAIPTQRGEDPEHGKDSDHERGLVVRSEPVDRQFLDAGWDAVDDAVADAHHRRRQAAATCPPPSLPRRDRVPPPAPPSALPTTSARPQARPRRRRRWRSDRSGSDAGGHAYSQSALRCGHVSRSTLVLRDIT